MRLAATLLRRLADARRGGGFAAFVASDRADAMTGEIVTVSCGSLVD